MKYAMCPKCGRRLCKGENGTKVEMECPKCGEFASVIIEEDDIHISKKPIFARAYNFLYFKREVQSPALQSAIIKRAEHERQVLFVFLSEIKTQWHAGGIYHCFFR